MCAQALNLWVFREDRCRISGQQAKSALRLEIAQCSGSSSHGDPLLAVLLRAGELECAVADIDNDSAKHCAALTDSVAEALVSRNRCTYLDRLLKQLDSLVVPESLEVSPPEGFAYYALHPLAYAKVLDQIPGLRESIAVIGIRSIGTTLSAVMMAAARQRGIKTERITVRPEGHPYNRRTRWSPAQRDFVRHNAERGSTFLVVDEGPGLSGSSFLSVAEAIEEVGAEPGCMTLVCSHEPRLDHMRAHDAAQRARRFRWQAVCTEPHRPQQANIFVGGGEWRNHLFAAQDRWPASWISLERLKYLPSREDEDRAAQRRLYKFIGLGHYGRAAFDREDRLAAAEFGPAPRGESEGFVSYPWICGRPMRSQDLSERVLERLAEYCAFRAREFMADRLEMDSLQQMAEHNLNQFEIDLPLRLRVESPVSPDGRMQPHEWLATRTGEILKTDSGAHGDDHFFPGATDIAWDLAGAIVEWNMSLAQRRFFLESYAKTSGDDAEDRLNDYVIAYTAFRRAYCLMAANALCGNPEQQRLQLTAAEYESVLLEQAQKFLAHVQS